MPITAPLAVALCVSGELPNEINSTPQNSPWVVQRNDVEVSKQVSGKLLLATINTGF